MHRYSSIRPRTVIGERRARRVEGREYEERFYYIGISTPYTVMIVNTQLGVGMRHRISSIERTTSSSRRGDDGYSNDG